MYELIDLNKVRDNCKNQLQTKSFDSRISRKIKSGNDIVTIEFKKLR